MAKFKEGQKVIITYPESDPEAGVVYADADDTPIRVTGPDGHMRGYPIEWISAAPDEEE